MCGWVIKAPNGTIVNQRSSGYTFTSTILFGKFCPVGGCPVAPTVTYKVYTTDSWGDGWEGTVLAFQQNGVTISTFTLSAGSSGGPADYTFEKSATVTIKVSVLGYYTNEVGFTIRNAAGAVVFQRNPGTSFYAGNILGTFCPECVNLSPVSILAGSDIHQGDRLAITHAKEEKVESSKGFMIATIVLASVLFLVILALGFSVFKYVKLSQKVNDELGKVPVDIASGKSITTSVEVMHNI